MNKIYCLYRLGLNTKVSRNIGVCQNKNRRFIQRIDYLRRGSEYLRFQNNLHVTTHQFNFLNNQTYYPTCYLLLYLKLYSKEKNMNVNQITITLRDGLCLKSLKEIDRLDYLAVTGQLSNLHRLLKYKLKDRGLSMAFQRTNMKRIHSRPKWNEL